MSINKAYFLIFLLLGCNQQNSTHWDYDIGEMAVHKLTGDTVMVVDRRSKASGIIAIRHKDYSITEAREEELRKIKP